MRSQWPVRTCLLVAGLLMTGVAGSLHAQSQDSAPSLGEVARQSRSSEAKRAKVVVNDENVRAYFGPIPRVALNGSKNTAEIVRKILDYRGEHTAQDTEQVLHDWYDEEVSAVRDLQREARNISAARSSEYYDRDYYDSDRAYDPKHSAADNKFSRLANDRDSNATQNKYQAVQRIRDCMSSVQQALFRVGINYDWLRPYFPDNPNE